MLMRAYVHFFEQPDYFSEAKEMDSTSQKSEN